MSEPKVPSAPKAPRYWRVDHTNGFRISTWIKPEHIEVVGDET